MQVSVDGKDDDVRVSQIQRLFLTNGRCALDMIEIGSGEDEKEVQKKNFGRELQRRIRTAFGR